MMASSLTKHKEMARMEELKIKISTLRIVQK